MTELEFMCASAMETNSKLQSSLSKCMRFGFTGHTLGVPNSLNCDELLKSYYELCAVMEMILNSGNAGRMSPAAIELTKEKKVEDIRTALVELKRSGSVWDENGCGRYMGICLGWGFETTKQ